MTCCSIIPPYILERLAAGSAGETAAARADQTLRVQERLRRDRLGVAGRATRPGLPVIEPLPGDGPHRTIHDAAGTEDLPGVVVRREGEDPTDDASVTRAYDGLGATWDLLATYGRDSLDGRGLPLTATVHFGQHYDNAFWDGSRMVFGDGDGVIFNDFTCSVDVIGHELVHGVTQYTSGLNYRGQSGALNESVSDVFGVLVRQRLLGQRAEDADWLIGAELLAPGVHGVALRSMAAPGTAYDDPRLGKDPQPDHLDDFVVTSDDNGGVHLNSGIPNRAFHLAATGIGGHAWEGAGAIWWDTITGDIRADCDFATFAGLTVRAARARFGGREADAVAAAWTKVGVSSSPSSSAPTAPTPRQDEPSEGGWPPATLTLRRTGGFAGQVRERRVDVGALPESDAAAWQDLLRGRGLTDLAGAPSHPDAYCYGVTCDAPALDVLVPEPALPQSVRDLFERTLRG
ncbi:protealysin inhibitor emfourin [Janibacter sp. G56]|uniref:protealysin inhibitor emfourin n=1 Tax=Janibacter sp. G56 TaxID=3418717 RepID=UPI003D0293D9